MLTNVKRQLIRLKVRRGEKDGKGGGGRQREKM